MINNNQKGMTLFISIVIMGILLFITFAVVNITIKSTLFANSGKESQLAFFAADSGIECALYWDSKDPNPFNVKMSTFADYYVAEFSGVERTISPLDQKSNKTGFTSSNNQLVTTDSVNTSFADELIIALMQESGNGPVNQGPGFSMIFDPFTSRYNMLEYKTVSSLGSHNASGYYVNGSSGGDYTADIITFKSASSETPALQQAGFVYISDLSNPVEMTLPNPSANGDFIFIAVTYNINTYDIASITDTKGNTYVRARGPIGLPSSPWATEFWYAKNIIGTSGSERITITVNSPAFVPMDLDCNNQHITSGIGSSNDVSTNPAQPHRLGGDAAAANDNTSIFQLNFSSGTCAIIRVIKNDDGTTRIESRGYNTCDVSSPRRVERGVEVTY